MNDAELTYNKSIGDSILGHDFLTRRATIFNEQKGKWVNGNDETFRIYYGIRNI